MFYDYACTSCETVFELNKTSTTRDEPLHEPCPKCDTTGFIHRLMSAPAITTQTSGKYSAANKAGNEWNDVLKGIKKASGRATTIETK